MTIGTKIFTWLCGKEIGSDEFGNRYFTEKKSPASRRAKRWVIYKDFAEASRVPPDWHGWLHYTTDTVPTAQGLPTAKPWIKQHQPNYTGTANAYLPKGHVLRGGQRAEATGDYEPWVPN